MQDTLYIFFIIPHFHHFFNHFPSKIILFAIFSRSKNYISQTVCLFLIYLCIFMQYHRIPGRKDHPDLTQASLYCTLLSVSESIKWTRRGIPRRVWSFRHFRVFSDRKNSRDIVPDHTASAMRFFVTSRAKAASIITLPKM